MANKDILKETSLHMSSSCIFILALCFSTTINLSFLYYSGILSTTAQNLDEISKLTNAAARVAGGIADYLNVFDRVERLEKSNKMFAQEEEERESERKSERKSERNSFSEQLEIDNLSFKDNKKTTIMNMCPEFICSK